MSRAGAPRWRRSAGPRTRVQMLELLSFALVGAYFATGNRDPSIEYRNPPLPDHDPPVPDADPPAK